MSSSYLLTSQDQILLDVSFDEELGFDKLLLNDWHETEQSGKESAQDKHAVALAVESLRQMLQTAAFGTLLYSSSEVALRELATTSCFEAAKLLRDQKSLSAQFIDCKKLRKMVSADDASLASQEKHLFDVQLPLSRVDFLCLHQVDCFAGNTLLENFLFELYNRRKIAPMQQLLLTTRHKASDIAFELADLRSRLQSFPAFRIPDRSSLNTTDTVLRLAKSYRLSLDKKMAEYIATRTDRNTDALDRALSRLDIFQRKEKKALTIPLIKRALDI